jgi:iron complex transport system substrate-binding protein
MRTISHPTRRAAVAPAALLLTLSLAGCGSESDSADAATGGACQSTVSAAETLKAGTTGEPTGTTRQFVADNGTVEIPADPERIIATGYAVPVMLEADADLVGISTWSRGIDLMTDADLQQYEKVKKVMGDTADTMNYEAVANAKPDLIVLGVPIPVLGDIKMDRLEDIAPVVVLGPTRPDSWKELSRAQADAAGELDYYDAAKATYEAKVEELEEKYAEVLGDYCFGHVGAYGDVTAGNFQREFAGSWGTNHAGDIGASYYGGPAKPGEGSDAVSEYPSIEELPQSLEKATAITYTVDDSGQPTEPVKYVLNHDLWDTLPAVKAGKTIPIKYTEAATYPTAMRTLEEIDTAFAEAFADELK